MSMPTHRTRDLDVNNRMEGTVRGTIVREKDLGITISADMNVSKPRGIAALKGNRILGVDYEKHIRKKYRQGEKISADMKISEQCGIAASKGNQILGLIRRNITYKEKS